MTQKNLEAKTKWHSVLLAFSGWSFWGLYFAFYILTNFANYFAGTLCNLGILSSALICKSDPIMADGGWAGITPINPFLLISLFLVLLVVNAFLNHRKDNEVNKIDYFDLAFKLICIVLLPSEMVYSFVYIGLASILFLIVRGAQLVYAKNRARKITRIINNRIQFTVVIFLFFVFSLASQILLFKLGVNIHEIGVGNYIDCCKNEVLIGEHIFKTNANPPLCIYEKSRQKKEVCRLNYPISRSILEEPKDVHREW